MQKISTRRIILCQANSWRNFQRRPNGKPGLKIRHFLSICIELLTEDSNTCMHACTQTKERTYAQLFI